MLHRLLSSLLLVLFLAPITIQQIHFWQEDHHRNPHHCDATRQQQHLHDPEVLGWHSCPICLFHYDNLLSDTKVKAIAPPLPAAPSATWSHALIFPFDLCDHPFSRGPPAIFWA